ncbi:MAG: FadR/GntR family transcriptional regulator [Granulosicoccus sp.]
MPSRPEKPEKPETSPTDKKNPGTSAGQKLEWQVHDGLLARIRNGAYQLGQRLPSETSLATEFGVSRPIIRNALARLRESGLVISRQGAGSYVCNGEQPQPSGFGQLGSIEDISCYFGYRKLIECESAAQATKHATPASIKKLRSIIDDMDKLIEADSVTVDPDVRFHMAIAELSGNRFLVDSLDMLRPHTYFIGKFVRGLDNKWYRKGKRVMSTEHQDIVTAIESGDSIAASARMLKHLSSSEQRIFKGQ